jgi:hypothetical protein
MARRREEAVYCVILYNLYDRLGRHDYDFLTSAAHHDEPLRNPHTHTHTHTHNNN